MTNPSKHTTFYSQIKQLLQSSRNQVVRAIYQTMVATCFEIGRMNVEEEQQGNDRAVYGKQLIKGLSLELTKEFGRGFSITNMQQMRNFYLAYEIQQTVSAIFGLSWSHYLTLIRISDKNERKFYEIEASKNN